MLQTLKAGGEGMTEDEMVGWHHQHNGHEYEQTLGDGEGQENLVCCSPWGCKESDMTEQLNNNKRRFCIKCCSLGRQKDLKQLVWLIS